MEVAGGCQRSYWPMGAGTVRLADQARVPKQDVFFDNRHSLLAGSIDASLPHLRDERRELPVPRIGKGHQERKVKLTSSPTRPRITGRRSDNLHLGYVNPNAFIAAVIGSEKKMGSTRSTMSPDTSRKFRLFSNGISARRAPLSMPT